MKVFGWLIKFDKADPTIPLREIRADFAGFNLRLGAVEEELSRVTRQLEAIRKKVYRDEVGSDGQTKSLPQELFKTKTYRTGDPI